MNIMREKGYAVDQERLARFAKAMGHPARIAILDFWPGRRAAFRRHSRGAAHLEGDRVPASQGVEGCRADSGRD